MCFSKAGPEVSPPRCCRLELSQPPYERSTEKKPLRILSKQIAFVLLNEERTKFVLDSMYKPIFPHDVMTFVRVIHSFPVICPEATFFYLIGPEDFSVR